MSDLTPELGPKIVEAITTNAEEAAGALGRAFESEFILKPGEPAGFDPSTTAEALAGGGLVFLFQFGDEGVAAALPASSELVPDWVKTPDPTGESKLSTLAQELSMLLIPEDLMAEVFEARWVEDIPTAITQSEPTESSSSIAVEIAAGETLGILQMVWPITKPSELYVSEAAEADDSSEEAESDSEEEVSATDERKPNGGFFDKVPSDYRGLPPNTLSFMQVKLDVSVSLASKTEAIQEIIELGPGAIISFNKSCNDLLEINVGECPIAEGEAVKVGEKFGVRVRNMIMPQEAFKKLQPPKVG